MILLLGGASETMSIALALLDAGCRVLASMATEAALRLPVHERFHLRRGRLDRDGFAALIRDRGIRAVVDASHPFATELRREIANACGQTGVARIRYERSTDPVVDLAGAELVDDHAQAAKVAFSRRGAVLLTTGSRNLSPYVEESLGTGIDLYARVLPGVESVQACRLAGLRESRTEFARGPFTVRENREILRRWNIGVMVAKDGGAASGIAERLEAARLERVRMVVVRRPMPEPGAVTCPKELLSRLWASA